MRRKKRKKRKKEIKKKSLVEVFRDISLSKDFLIFFSIIVVFVFTCVKKISEAKLEDYSEIIKGKGFVYDAETRRVTKTRDGKFYLYHFEYEGIFYAGEVSERQAMCQVGDSCIIRFAKENPNVNKYFETIPNPNFSK